VEVINPLAALIEVYVGKAEQGRLRARCAGIFARAQEKMKSKGKHFSDGKVQCGTGVQ
jgi:hypothetical protein